MAEILNQTELIDRPTRGTNRVHASADKWRPTKKKTAGLISSRRLPRHFRGIDSRDPDHKAKSSIPSSNLGCGEEAVLSLCNQLEWLVGPSFITCRNYMGESFVELIGLQSGDRAEKNRRTR